MAGERVRSMEEFATLSGISRPTLSKYFSNPSAVRASTRERIETALSVHNYRPNLFAMNGNRQVARIIGVLVPHLVDPFFAEIVRRIEDRCIEEGFLAVTLSSHGEPDLETRAIDTLRSLKPAGCIVAPLGVPSDLSKIDVLMSEVPVVMLDAFVRDNAPFVGTDNFHSIRSMVDYLSRTGERPCFMAMPAVNGNAQERRKAYVEAMAAIGQESMILDPRTSGWDFEEIGFQEMRWRLTEAALPSRTVLCANDRMAIGAISAAGAAGLSIGLGRDIRIAGHDDHPQARFTNPPLTTVAQDYTALAARSMEMLMRLVVGETPAPEHLRLPTRLMLRGSA